MFYGSGFDIMFTLAFVLIFGMIVVSVIRMIGEWNQNNQSPKLTVEAKLVAKRASVSHHHHSGGNGAGHMTTSTTYYVTFEVESGDRMEFHVSGREYGLLAEGDQGRLSFQGTRYLGFERR